MKEYIVELKYSDKKKLKKIFPMYVDSKVTGEKEYDKDLCFFWAKLTKKNIIKLSENTHVKLTTTDNKKYLGEKTRNAFSKQNENNSEIFIFMHVMGSVKSIRKPVQEMVATGNRFTDLIPKDEGKYYNVNEIEYYLSSLNGKNDFIEVIELPFMPIRRNEKSRAIVIGKNEPGKKAVLITGGMHGNEWVPPDALLRFIQLILDKYENNHGIDIRGFHCSNSDVKKIIESLQLIIFPQVNPAGRHYSQTSSNFLHRKNLNGSGVDINRNFDFLWKFWESFHPNALPSVVISTDPTNFCYQGLSSGSENETQNVLHLLNRFRNIEYYLDIHSYNERAILYNWGNDDTQTGDSDKNFENQFYNLKRGLSPSDEQRLNVYYDEFVTSSDNIFRLGLAEKMKQAIISSSNKRYNIKTSYQYYPTACTATNYVDSLSYRNPPIGPKIHSFTIECGTSFWPEIPEKELVIEEVISAILELCRNVD